MALIRHLEGKFGVQKREAPVYTLGIQGLGEFDASGWLDLRWWAEQATLIPVAHDMVRPMARLAHVPVDLPGIYPADRDPYEIRLEACLAHLHRTCRPGELDVEAECSWEPLCQKCKAPNSSASVKCQSCGVALSGAGEEE